MDAEMIPEDILKAARGVVADPTANIYTCIARALLAERLASTERAAKIAESQHLYELAAAIRSHP